MLFRIATPRLESLRKHAAALSVSSSLAGMKNCEERRRNGEAS
ncbi:hypothetical protein AKJ09_03018 [Labilithrix luteola]|uniref:Uncharacterized protein n=1 Tax=Labilithrix luteola TaxID=1391654 RepID=A0A0K1PT97_9BACT|nr:hypothetical protein AKJ09_03018 [Labilithrix luteola]